MAHKEYGMTDILDLLRRAKAKDSLRRIARATGMDRKTVRNYLHIAAEHGFGEAVPDEQLPEIAAAVFRSLHAEPTKTAAPGACAPLLPHRELLSGWLEADGLTLTKAHIKLGRMGVEVGYSTLYRYVRETLGFGGPKVTVRMADTAPGEVAQCDFGRMGLVFDPEAGRDRVLHALVVTLVFSRHQYVFLTHRQDLDALIAGIEEAWERFGGVTRRLIIDYVPRHIIDVMFPISLCGHRCISSVFSRSGSNFRAHNFHSSSSHLSNSSSSRQTGFRRGLSEEVTGGSHNRRAFSLARRFISA